MIGEQDGYIVCSVCSALWVFCCRVPGYVRADAVLSAWGRPGIVRAHQECGYSFTTICTISHSSLSALGIFVSAVASYAGLSEKVLTSRSPDRTIRLIDGVFSANVNWSQSGFGCPLWLIPWFLCFARALGIAGVWTVRRSNGLMSFIGFSLSSTARQNLFNALIPSNHKRAGGWNPKNKNIRISARCKILFENFESVVKFRIPIIILRKSLLIPLHFRYHAHPDQLHMLDYLPSNMDTVKGQDILMDEFGKGAFPS